MWQRVLPGDYLRIARDVHSGLAFIIVIGYAVCPSSVGGGNDQLRYRASGPAFPATAPTAAPAAAPFTLWPTPAYPFVAGSASVVGSGCCCSGVAFVVRQAAVTASALTLWAPLLALFNGRKTGLSPTSTAGCELASTGVMEGNPMPQLQRIGCFRDEPSQGKRV
jgi:hypothetical protein